MDMFVKTLPEGSVSLDPNLTKRTEVAARDALAGGRRGLRALLPLAGPAVISSVSYMDPGNFATNLQAGSTYGYQLLWVVVAASLVAMLFQALSARLGIVTGYNLAQLCRLEFAAPVVRGMWIASELAAIATDVAEFLGAALGFSLLLHLPLLAAMGITAAVTYAILSLDKRGFRPLELVIGALVATVGLSYLCELVLAPPDWRSALYHSVVPQLRDGAAVTLAVGIIGATIMPHALYLHSGLTQERAVARNEYERGRLMRFSNTEVILAMGFAGVINMAMVAMAAAVSGHASSGLGDIGSAYRTLIPALGFGAAALFLVSLLASGVSSSVVGTLAGQLIMQGFVGFSIPLWLRRMITMIPAFAIALWCPVMQALVLSQVVLSFVLPLPMVALVVLSMRKSLMGKYVMRRRVAAVAIAATASVVALNAVLIWQALSLAAADPGTRG